MKVGALLCGLLASAFAWAAPYVLSDLTPAFLALWPIDDPPFSGLLAWHALIATGVLGGLLCVLTPATGTLVLLAGAVGWAVLGTQLAGGFTIQVLVPLGLCALAALFALAAAIRAGLRRRRDRYQMSEEELDREDALQMEPEVELRRAAALKGVRAMREAEPEDDELTIEGVDEREPRSRQLPVYDATVDRDDDDHPVTHVIERRGNPVLGLLNLIVLLLLCAAVAVLLYSEYVSGGLSAAFNLPAPTSVAMATAVSAPVMPAEVPTLETPALAPVTTPPPPEVKVSTTPLNLADLSTSTWDDPFAYCAAIGTVDGPDRRYAGPASTPAIGAAFASPTRAPRWRCLNGALLACTAATDAACDPTPSVAQMIAHCTANPPSGTWSCRGTRPEIPLGQAWPVDARGFLPGAWKVVPAPTG